MWTNITIHNDHVSGSSHMMCATSIESSRTRQGESRSRSDSIVRSQSVYVLDGVVRAMLNEILPQRAVLVEGQSEMQRCLWVIKQVSVPYILTLYTRMWTIGHCTTHIYRKTVHECEHIHYIHTYITTLAISPVLPDAFWWFTLAPRTTSISASLRLLFCAASSSNVLPRSSSVSILKPKSERRKERKEEDC